MCNRSFTSAGPVGSPVKQTAEHQLLVSSLSHVLFFPAYWVPRVSLKYQRPKKSSCSAGSFSDPAPDAETSANSAGEPTADTGEQRSEQPGSIYGPVRARFFITKAINSAELAMAKASSSHRSKRHSLICSLKYLRGSLKINGGKTQSPSQILNEAS